MSYKHLHGKMYITETLLGNQFQIHPLSFFQCNLHGAEVLYKTVEELCQFKNNTILLDVCCGTGIYNAEYFSGLAEKLLPQILQDHIEEEDDIVAVLNPGRGGVGKKVTRALRRCENIRRVVFASCKPLGRMQFNMIELCCPINEEFVGEPFLPTKAIPVDMFPHTRHYELVVLFER
ncbi:hypothetical protein LSH36_150g02030 [Paralvinella palmiformis]|uniref:Uncharacterized protein n=1 Tax=Paralvinella palmiformis TaxID=53620 RepID=A0AAD9JVS8_9ANNE|nr:hypothetical protein LSH36_150g02030 [Paralvinella palmiformis]